MTKTSPTVLVLREYEPAFFTPAQLSEPVARLLHQHYHAQVDVQPPSFRTGNRWQLTARSWVGYIPLLPDLGISLQPKVPLSSLFGMLEVAYA
ncbi:MAG: restriction endonuclease, partial [Chloroflexota bacterium]|nr:restriction endonuclease [Chloroflexota bacterium]